MKVAKILVVGLALALPFAACGGKAKTKLTLEEAKGPGRDLELHRQGVDAIRKGNWDEGRILLNTMINTYSDSPMIKMSKLSIADSYYLQGGSKGLAQSIAVGTRKNRVARVTGTAARRPAAVNRGRSAVAAPAARAARRKMPGAEYASGQATRWTSSGVIPYVATSSAARA